MTLHLDLLKWYDIEQRHLPWRALPGAKPNPYHVLLSEFMLQQTTVATVINYFHRFIERWPTIGDLAAATQSEVYYQWQGLGYYSRANNLWRCAQVIEAEYGGRIPNDPKELLQLPGVGPYTAAAIASIAFDYPIVPVDGNIIRVLSRFLNIETPLPGLQHQIRQIVTQYSLTERSGDFAQALMDLGATVCTPRKVNCLQCPLQHGCQSLTQGVVEMRPVKAVGAIRPTRYGYVFWYTNEAGAVWVRQRPPKGLLANLMEIPGSDWLPSPAEVNEVIASLPSSHNGWKLLPIPVKHTFTHFHLQLQILVGQGDHTLGDKVSACDKLKDLAFPTLMRKVITAVLQHKDSCNKN